MEFFLYKPEEVKIGDTVIGNARTRFRDTVFSAHSNQIPTLNIYPEKVTTYLDGRDFSEGLDVLNASVDATELGRSIDLYHPILGTVVGTITIGEIIGIVYSLCIDTDKRNEERIAAELAAQETTTTTTVS
jgi:hypothetical protein